MNQGDEPQTSISPAIATDTVKQILHVAPSSSATLQPIAQIIAPVNIDTAAEAFQKFDQFKKRILTANDVVDIQGKLYLKKSAWTKWALVCNVSDRLVSYERVPAEGRDAEGGFYYRVVWEAFHQPTGRSSVGTGITSSREKKAWAHEEHDIFATACTRAKNRAVSNLVGGGEVSAEEMISEVDAKLTTTESEPAESTSDAEPGQTLAEYPLTYKRDAVGIVKIDSEHSRAIFLPEKSVREDSAPVRGFLVPRILEPMKTKHGLQHTLNVRDGFLESFTITPLPTPEQLDELMTGTAWAFAKGSEANSR
jgi:hypothetical protein